jgi:hypothetical protein
MQASTLFGKEMKAFMKTNTKYTALATLIHVRILQIRIKNKVVNQRLKCYINILQLGSQPPRSSCPCEQKQLQLCAHICSKMIIYLLQLSHCEFAFQPRKIPDASKFP